MIDQCGRCEQSFHPEHYDGPVYDQDGQEYEHIMDTDSSDRPFFCPDCWAVLNANQKTEEHQTLAEWL